MLDTVILTTTINVPHFIDGICKNIIKFKKKEKIKIIVIADKKTPTKSEIYCNSLAKKYKIDIDYFNIKRQDKFFKKEYKNIYKFFPYNDAIRKLLGSVYLFKSLPKRLIFIDDDNFINQKVDFIKAHQVTGKKLSTSVISNQNNWPNIYKFFSEKNNIPFFPRGYPWEKRSVKSSNLKIKNKNVRIIANCGFILDDPDIDAISRLFWRIKTLGVKTKKYLAVEKNNFFPLNDQNTSIEKDYIPIYYKPISAGRNSDIWTSYFISKIGFLYNDYISYGPPHLKQIRNIHDYWKDLELEKAHNLSTDIFAETLKNVKLKKNKCKINASIELCNKSLIYIKKKQKKMNSLKLRDPRHYQGFSEKEKIKRDIVSCKYISEYFKEYLIWLKEVKKVIN